MSDRDHEGRFIRFERVPMGKTDVWNVVTKRGSDILGYVEWYAPWRKYAFNPGGYTGYEEVCLREIADFCEARTKEHKVRRATG